MRYHYGIMRRFVWFEDYKKKLQKIKSGSLYDKYFRNIDALATSGIPPLTWIEINLSALKCNLDVIRKHINNRVGVIGVLKADAFGHGIVPSAIELQKGGIEKIAVGTCEEALILKKHDVTCPIMTLYPILLGANIKLLINKGIEITVTNVQQIKDIIFYSNIVKKHAKIHILIETGLNKYGIPLDNVVNVINTIKQSNYIVVEGVYSHLANPTNNTYSSYQFNQLLKALSIFKSHNIYVYSVHLASTGGLLHAPYSYNPNIYKQIYPSIKVYVRLGDLLFGMYKNLKPALGTQRVLSQLVTHINDIKYVKKGEYIGYDNNHRLLKDTELCLLSVGWSNGLPLNDVYVYNGRRNIKVIGGITCNNIAFENIDHQKIGDRVYLLCNDTKDRLTSEYLAQRNDLRTSALVYGLGKNIPRIYYYT